MPNPQLPLLTALTASLAQSSGPIVALDRPLGLMGQEESKWYELSLIRPPEGPIQICRLDHIGETPV